jgi:hypothetical protein
MDCKMYQILEMLKIFLKSNLELIKYDNRNLQCSQINVKLMPGSFLSYS